MVPPTAFGPPPRCSTKSRPRLRRRCVAQVRRLAQRLMLDRRRGPKSRIDRPRFIPWIIFSLLKLENQLSGFLPEIQDGPARFPKTTVGVLVFFQDGIDLLKQLP